MAKTIDWASRVRLAEKNKHREPEPAYEFSGRTFKKKPTPPGKHVKSKP